MPRGCRVARRGLAVMMASAVLIGCGGSDREPSEDTVEAERAALIRYSPMYSAYDGVRDYKLPVFLEQSLARVHHPECHSRK